MVFFLRRTGGRGVVEAERVWELDFLGVALSWGGEEDG